MRGQPGRGRMTSYKAGQKLGRVTTKSNLEKCLKCHGYNHSIEDCPRPRGISMMILEDGTEIAVEDYGEEEEGDQHEDLN